MFRIIKWCFYGFIFVFLWQISETMNGKHEQVNDMVLQLSNKVEKNAQKMIENQEDSIRNVQKNIELSVIDISRQYIDKIMKY